MAALALSGRLSLKVLPHEAAMKAACKKSPLARMPLTRIFVLIDHCFLLAARAGTKTRRSKTPPIVESGNAMRQLKVDAMIKIQLLLRVAVKLRLPRAHVSRLLPIRRTLI